MGDICMKLLANIVSFISMIVGTLVSVLAKYTAIVDESISTIAALIGLAGALVWLLIALTKRKQSKVALDNERLDNKIKREQLKQLQSNETNPTDNNL